MDRESLARIVAEIEDATRSTVPGRLPSLSTTAKSVPMLALTPTPLESLMQLGEIFGPQEKNIGAARSPSHRDALRTRSLSSRETRAISKDTPKQSRVVPLTGSSDNLLTSSDDLQGARSQEYEAGKAKVTKSTQQMRISKGSSSEALLSPLLPPQYRDPNQSGCISHSLNDEQGKVDDRSRQPAELQSSDPITSTNPRSPGSSPNHTNKELRKQHAIVLSPFCRFALNTVRNFLEMNPAQKTIQERKLRNIGDKLWKDWKEGRITQRVLVESVAALVKTSCNEGQDYDLIGNFKVFWAAECEAQKIRQGQIEEHGSTHQEKVVRPQSRSDRNQGASAGSSVSTRNFVAMQERTARATNQPRSGQNRQRHITKSMPLQQSAVGEAGSTSNGNRCFNHQDQQQCQEAVSGSRRIDEKPVSAQTCGAIISAGTDASGIVQDGKHSEKRQLQEPDQHRQERSTSGGSTLGGKQSASRGFFGPHQSDTAANILEGRASKSQQSSFSKRPQQTIRDHEQPVEAFPNRRNALPKSVARSTQAHPKPVSRTGTQNQNALSASQAPSSTEFFGKAQVDVKGSTARLEVPISGLPITNGARTSPGKNYIVAEQPHCSHGREQVSGRARVSEKAQDSLTTEAGTQKFAGEGHSRKVRVQDERNIVRNIVDIGDEVGALERGTNQSLTGNKTNRERDSRFLLHVPSLRSRIETALRNQGLEVNVLPEVMDVLNLACQERLSGCLADLKRAKDIRLGSDKYLWKTAPVGENIYEIRRKHREDEERALTVAAEVRTRRRIELEEGGRNQDNEREESIGAIYKTAAFSRTHAAKRLKRQLEREKRFESGQRQALASLVQRHLKRPKASRGLAPLATITKPQGNSAACSDRSRFQVPAQADYEAPKSEGTGPSSHHSKSTITLQDCIYVMGSDPRLRKGPFMYKWSSRVGMPHQNDQK